MDEEVSALRDVVRTLRAEMAAAAAAHARDIKALRAAVEAQDARLYALEDAAQARAPRAMTASPALPPAPPTSARSHASSSFYGSPRQPQRHRFYAFEPAAAASPVPGAAPGDAPDGSPRPAPSPVPASDSGALAALLRDVSDSIASMRAASAGKPSPRPPQAPRRPEPRAFVLDTVQSMGGTPRGAGADDFSDASDVESGAPQNTPVMPAAHHLPREGSPPMLTLAGRGQRRPRRSSGRVVHGSGAGAGARSRRYGAGSPPPVPANTPVPAPRPFEPSSSEEASPQHGTTAVAAKSVSLAEKLMRAAVEDMRASEN